MSDLVFYLLMALVVVLVVAQKPIARGISRAWDALVRDDWETGDGVATLDAVPVGAGRCVACGSDDLGLLAPRVYRCRACGYEGGENRVAWERTRSQAAWGARPWSERLAAARSGVQDTLRQLLAVEDDARRWPALEVIQAYSSSLVAREYYRANVLDDLTAARQRQHAKEALLEAIRMALAPLYAAADAVPGLEIPPPDDPAWDGEPDAVFARAQATVTGALARIDEVQEKVLAGAEGAALAGPTRSV